MATKVIEEQIYYRVESPRGVMSDYLTENDLDHVLKKGEFSLFLWRGDAQEAYAIKKYKVGKVFKYTRQTTLIEEEITR